MRVSVGKPLRDLVRLCFEADQPLLLVGRHGIGKSKATEEAARELGIEHISRDLSLMEPPDLVGLPRLEGGVTRYCPPAFLPTGGRGLLVFEELNRCPAYMRVPCLELLTRRALNDYRLPPGWLPVAAVNPAGAEYEVDALDPALLSRFVEAEVVADTEEWLAWAREREIHPGVLRYVESDPEVFADPRSNPRAWEGVSRLLQARPRAGVPDAALRAAVTGRVGDERGAAFLRFLRDRLAPLTADQIITSYAAHRAQLRAWADDGRLDLVRSSLLNLQKHLQLKRHYTAARRRQEAWGNVGSFLADLPGDLYAQAKVFFAERDYKMP
jgi:hypothetical protein